MTAPTPPAAPAPAPPAAPAAPAQPNSPAAAPAVPAAPPAGQAPAAPPEAQPPWEKDGQPFDPDRAWNLIQTLRSEKQQTAAERDTFKTKVTEFERSQMTEQQRLEQERDSSRQERDAARSDATRLRMALKYQLAEDDLDLLGEGTDEQIEGRAKRLAERAATAPTSPVSRRPTERLRPGSGDPAATPEETDLKKLGERMFSR